MGNARSDHRSVFRLWPLANRFLFGATAVALGIHVVALYLPPTQALLGMEPLGLVAWFRIVLVATINLIAVEAHKRVRYPVAVPGDRPRRRLCPIGEHGARTSDDMA